MVTQFSRVSGGWKSNYSCSTITIKKEKKEKKLQMEDE